MKSETNAILAILIHEIKEIIEDKKDYSANMLYRIDILLNSWIHANDLPLEKVQSMNIEDFEKEFGIKVPRVEGRTIQT